MASKFRPRLLGNQPMMMDPLHIALYYAHKSITREARRMTAMEWIRSGAPVPTERPEVIAEDQFRAKFNLAPRRL